MEHSAPGNDREVLRRRARELARVSVPDIDGERIDIVEFHLGREHLAVESAWVREVFVPREIVPLPGAPPFVAGLVNRRGIVYSVVDLGVLLDLPAVAGQPSVVVLLGDERMEFGLLVVRVETTRQLLLHDIQPPPPTLPAPARRYLRGLLPGAVSLLDARLLLHSPQLLVDQREHADL